MRLYEFEAKQLAERYGIKVPKGRLATSASEITGPCVVKAQVLAGKRRKGGAVKVCETADEARAAASHLLGHVVLGEKVDRVYLEEFLIIEKEYYLSLTYDGSQRVPVAIFSAKGGIEIEEVARTSPGDIHTLAIDPEKGLRAFEARQLVAGAGVPGEIVPALADVFVRAWKCMAEKDARVFEINPLAQTKGGELIAAGVAVDIDDQALYRHPELFFPERIPLGRPPTEREVEARKIDLGDYRGSAGKYIELEGDVAMLLAGGGASLACMDALINAGGKPANYSEYSGNPPKEKVYQLAKIVLGKPGLTGAWIVGAIASFTRIDDTLAGVAQAIRELKPEYPLVVRRAGPGEKEGLELMRSLAKEGVRIEVHGAETPMAATARRVVELSEAFKEKPHKKGR